MIKSFPQPPTSEKGLLEWARKMYAALVESEAMRRKDEEYYGVRHDSTEPPDPHPGMFWVSDHVTETTGGYCKIRLDATAPSPSDPGMLWFYTSTGDVPGAGSPGTKVLHVRSEWNEFWYSFLSTGSSGNDFCCYVSQNTPSWTQAGMLWMDVISGGMDSTDALNFKCRAYVGDDAPSPTESKTAWYDT